MSLVAIDNIRTTLEMKCDQEDNGNIKYVKFDSGYGYGILEL